MQKSTKTSALEHCTPTKNLNGLENILIFDAGRQVAAVLGRRFFTTMTLDNCTFLSLNVRGLRSFGKRGAIFSWLKVRKQTLFSYKKHIVLPKLKVCGRRNGEVKSFVLMLQAQ